MAAEIIYLRQWKKPLTKVYNGFTPFERIRGWQVTHWLIDTRHLPDPKKDNCSCTICGKAEGVNYHNENYYEPWTAKLVYRSCHYYLHTRFRIDHALYVLLKRGADRPEAEWVDGLSKSKIDLAPNLRALHGNQVRGFPVLLNKYPSFPEAQLADVGV